MNILVKYFFFMPILFLGCNHFSDQTEKVKSVQSFPDLIENAIKNNEPLPGFSDTSYTLKQEYNQLMIDSISAGNKKYFTLLLEYPNPTDNRFLIYDSSYSPILIDKSLNGKLTLTSFEKENEYFININEAFISKNIFTLNRFSLYKIQKDTAFLALRTLTYLKKPDIEYFQKITSITKDSIVTELSASKKSVINGERDIFYFDHEKHKYIGQKNIFDNLMQEHIDHELTPEENEITDEESAKVSMEIIPGKNNNKFFLNLSDEWNEVKNIIVSDLIKRKAAATKFINTKIGAEVIVIQLTAGDSSESYITTALNNTAEGNYKVRFSEKNENGKDYFHYFEYSCGDKCYLLILKTPKNTYNNFKENIYNDIVNTFSMDC